MHEMEQLKGPGPGSLLNTRKLLELVTDEVDRGTLLWEGIPGRCERHRRPGRCRMPWDVFICHASEDAPLAGQVADFLAGRGKRVFFAPKNRSDKFSQAIDEALESVSCLVAVATAPAHLSKPWLEYEWRSFHVDVCSGLKPGAAQLLSFISFSPSRLPRPLRFHRAVLFDPANLEAGLETLAECVMQAR